MTTNSIIKVQNSVIILAAGLSERMGQPKAFMKWNKHITFLEKYNFTSNPKENAQGAKFLN